jgi:hypothetical protein
LDYIDVVIGLFGFFEEWSLLKKWESPRGFFGKNERLGMRGVNARRFGRIVSLPFSPRKLAEIADFQAKAA